MKKWIFLAFIWYLPLQLKLPNIPVFPMINVFMILLLGIFMSSRVSRFEKPSYEIAINLFLSMWFVSFVYACVFTDGMARVEIAREFKRLYFLPVGYYVLSRCIKDKKEVNFYFGAFLICLCVAGWNTYRNGVLGGANFALHKRSSGPFGVGWRASDIAGGYIATFTPLLVAYFFFAKKGILKFISAVGITYCGMGLMTTYSRGSMMALLFACIGIIIFGTKELAKGSKVNFLVIFIGLVLGIVFWKAWVPQAIIARVEGTIVSEEVNFDLDDMSVYDDYGESSLDASSQLRMQAWQAGLTFFKENPLTGIGFRQVQFQLGHDPHNAFVLIASEMGIIGFMLFLFLILTVFRQSYKLIGTEFTGLAVGCMGMMVGFCVVNMFYSNFFRDNVVGSFWIMLGILAAANNVIQGNAESSDGKTGKPTEPEPKKKTYADYRKRYLESFVLFLVGSLIFTGHVDAKLTSKHWDEEDIPHLNAMEDIGASRVGRIFYVDQKNGNDEGGGQSLRDPFKTIRRALRKLKAGDTVLIKAGTYHETFWIRTQGTPEAPVLIGPYGDGEVIIDDGLKVGEWTQYKGNVYKTSCEKSVRAMVVDEQPMYPTRERVEIVEGLWYYDKEAKELYAHIPGGGNPDDHVVGVIVDNKYSHAIFINGAHHVTLYGLTIRFAGGKGVEILGSNNRVERCNIKFNGSHGIGMFTYKKLNSEYTSVIRNQIYHNMMANWPRGRWPFKKGGWGMGVGGPAGPHCKYIGNVIHKNGGEGLGAQSESIVHDNIIMNNWSVNLYMDGSENLVVDKNFIYCEEPNKKDLFNNYDKHPGDGKSFRRLRAEGIMTADEKKKTNSHNIQITNNIIIGCRRGITHYGRSRKSGLKNILIAHNTIVVPDAKGLSEKFIGIRVPWNNGNNTGTIYRNNIIYATHKDTYLASVSNDPLGKADPFHGITFDHNIWFHASNDKPYHIGIPKFFLQDYDFEGWKKRGAHKDIAEGSKYVDPLFTSRKGYSVESVQLSMNSPIVDAAKKISHIESDFLSVQRDDKPDIGALEVKKK